MVQSTTANWLLDRLDPGGLADLANRYGVRRLAVFGSSLRDDFGPESDVDILVEFAPGRTPGLAFFALQDELTALIGRRVDLNTPRSLAASFRDAVLAEARSIYGEA